MDDLINYLFRNYKGLLTQEEKAAYQFIVRKNIASKTMSVDMQALFRGSWASNNPRVLELLSKGTEEFFKKVCDRILREHSDAVYLNLCPKCNSLARTPKATQCPKCLFSWR